MPKLQLSFHTTFAFKKEDIHKILQAATEEKGLDDSIEGLIERTGLGNKKIGSMKSWATRAGLVSGARLSPEGEIAWIDYLKNDKTLNSVVTDWLMHFYLSFGDKGLQSPLDSPADWGGWSYFVYTFLPQRRTFTADELQHHSASVFDSETSKNLTKNFRIMLRAYTESEALAACKFLTLEGDIYTTGNAPLPNPYLIGYFLAKLWKRDFGDTTSVLADDILHQKMGLSSILGVGTETLQTSLNQLETSALIEQRRTVSPAQIVRRWDDPLTLLEKAYAN